MLKTKKRKSRTNNKALARKRALKAMSDYVRNLENWECFTCGRVGEATTIDAGHFVSRTYNAILFDLRNVHAQCVYCNRYRSGAWDSYYEKMKELYGLEVIEELLEKRNEIKQFTIPELNALEDSFIQMLQELADK